MVRHERIYQHIRKNKAMGGDLYTYLRLALKHRKRPLSGTYIKDRVSIDLRPNIVNEKGRFCDWEINIIVARKIKGPL